MSSVLGDYESYSKGSFFLVGLPQSLQTAKTDADGKFSLKLKPGKYSLAAFSSRKVSDDTEEYYWLVWVTVGGEQPKRIMLSNDNLFNTNCVECVVSLKQLPDSINMQKLVAKKATSEIKFFLIIAGSRYPRA